MAKKELPADLKKFRDSQNAFMAEGLKLVIDALDLGWTIRTLIFAKSGLGNPTIEKVAARTVAAGGTVLEVSEKVLSAITRRDNPQIVVGVELDDFNILEFFGAMQHMHVFMQLRQCHHIEMIVMIVRNQNLIDRR